MHFYWVVEGKLAGCSLPGGTQPRGSNATSATYSPSQLRDASTDIQWLQRQGVGGLISLTEEPLPDSLFGPHDPEVLHLPVSDLCAPTPEQFAHALRFIDGQHLLGRGVAVHCLMGQGRTASVLAAYLIRSGETTQGSIDRLRELCPGALSSPEQERALMLYSQRRDWIL